MKKFFSLTFSAVIACFYLQAQSIKNAGFETGDSLRWKFETPASYSAKEPGYTCSIIKDPSLKKNFILQLASTQNSQWCQLKQGISYKPKDSVERLFIKALVKIEDGNNGSAGILLRTFGYGQDYGVKGAGLDKDTGWTNLSFDVLVNKQTDSLLLFCTMSGTGKAMFDNLTITKIDLGKPKQLLEAKTYLDTALNIIKRNALYKDSVDFNALTQQAYFLITDAQKSSDCYAAIQYVLSGLGDHHSFFLTPEQSAYMNRKEDAALPLPTGKKIENKIGYLKVTPIMAINENMEKYYADSLQNIIRLIDSAGIIGWIVDDRDNTGGNSFPMLLGLGPVLGDGIYERWKANGQIIDSSGYWNGTIRYKGSILRKIENPYKLYTPFPKVAVLMNGMCASSGEGVILNFKNRPNTRLFGEASYGLSTGNADFILQDSAMLFVCAVKGTDRLGNEYGGKLYPDEQITDNPATKKDEVIEAAVKWLLSN